MATGVTTALWRATRDQQSATLARQLMAQADAVRPTDPATALRLGLAAAAVHPADDTRSALAAQITTTRFAGALAGEQLSVDDAAFTADGRTMVTQGAGAVVLWDVTRSPPVRRAALPAAGRIWLSASTAGSRTVAIAPELAAAANPGGGTPVAAVAALGCAGPDPATPRPAGPTVSLGQTRGGRELALGTWWPGGAPALLTFSTSGRMLAVAGTVMPAASPRCSTSACPAASRRAFGPPLALGAAVTAHRVFDRSDRALLTGSSGGRSWVDGGRTASGPAWPDCLLRGDVETELVTWDITDPAAARPAVPAADPLQRGSRSRPSRGFVAAIRGGGRMSCSGTSATHVRPPRRRSHPSPPAGHSSSSPSHPSGDHLRRHRRGDDVGDRRAAGPVRRRPHPDTAPRAARRQPGRRWRSGSSSPPAVTSLGCLSWRTLVTWWSVDQTVADRLRVQRRRSPLRSGCASRRPAWPRSSPCSPTAAPPSAGDGNCSGTSPTAGSPAASPSPP